MKKILTSLAILTFGIGLNSQAQLITTAVPFLRIEPDSRIASMGNAGVAVADNAAAVFWNPAGLGFQTTNQVQITHANWLPNLNADLFYDYLAGTYHLEGFGTFGGHVTFLNFGEQTQTSEEGAELGTFNSFDLAGGLSVGIPISQNWSIGFGTRFVYSNLAPGIEVSGQETRAGTSVGIDVATLYRTNVMKVFGRNAQVKAGLNLSNVGSAIQYTDQAQEDPLPTILRVGASYTTDLDDEGYNTLTLAFDVSKLMAKRDTNGTAEDNFSALVNTWSDVNFFNGQRDVTLSVLEQFMVGGGLEYWYNKAFALRGGYFYEHPDNGDRQFFTLGAGLRYNIFGVDFSYIAAKDDSPLANTIRFSLLVNL